MLKTEIVQAKETREQLDLYVKNESFIKLCELMQGQPITFNDNGTENTLIPTCPEDVFEIMAKHFYSNIKQ
ncbi:MAG TPA: hypothetical protein PLZ52_10960 [Bacteroidales bacterium]|nr:hypothetical protein [Bacteroidales bacterium]HOE05728.1 hypothetical protein [Bacteroidales bacterium]